VAPGGQQDAFRGELNAQREADRVTVNQFAPPGVLINADLQILQFRGLTDAYLAPPAGKASFDVLKMARDGLRLPLRAAINRARKEYGTARQENVPVQRHDGVTRKVNVEVVPLKNLKERCFLILFEDSGKGARPGPGAPPRDQPGGAGRDRVSRKEEAGRIVELERELAETRDYLQSFQEHQEATTEELQASHEEGQSANEELQSLNEELETSKEELESTNEELTTVNEEMANRNIDLSRLNSDLTNLQTSTKLAIVLLARDLAIRRFSAQAKKQFNLMPTDVGRPFGSVRHDLDMPDLEPFVAGLIASVREGEREVRDRQGRWYSLQVRPYITLDNKVDGAVLVLVDINAAKESEQAVVAARNFAEAIIGTARDPLLILDSELRVEKANEAFYATFKVASKEAVGRSIFELDRGQWDDPKLRKLLQDILPRHSFFNNFEITQNLKNAGRRTLLLNARTLSQTSGQSAKILVGIQDVTELLHFQAEMRRSEVRYRRLFEAARDGVLLLDPESRKIVDANPFMTELLGYTHRELLGKELFEIGLLKDEPASLDAFRELRDKGFIRYDDLPLESKAGGRRDVEVVANLYRENGHEVIQCNIRDITDRKRAEATSTRLRATEESYRALFESIDEGFCIIEQVEGAAGDPLDFRYIEANPAFSVQSGLNGAVGKTVRQLVPGEPEEWFLTYEAVCRTGEAIRFERSLRTNGRVLELYAFQRHHRAQGGGGGLAPGARAIGQPSPSARTSGGQAHRATHGDEPAAGSLRLHHRQEQGGVPGALFGVGAHAGKTEAHGAPDSYGPGG
jgi:PAS domain S-box-containing protein